jgi:polyhydroxyalkanoate synthase
MSDSASSTLGGNLEDAATALDLVLTDAALGLRRRFRPGRETVRLVGNLSRRPRTVARHAGSLVREYGRIATGAAVVTPPRGDRRFTDPAWTGNPLLHRVVQAYLATARTAESALADANLDWRNEHRARFLLDNLIDAVSPSNNPFISPMAWKAIIDTGGASVVRGGRNLISDMASRPRIPTMVEPSAFEVGKTLAISPGWVVQRTPMFELIQYSPTTEQVQAAPLLIVPPMINKYYAVDLAPGRSLIEYLVSQGQQVFVMSWRNPDARQRQWGLDSYGQGVLEALDAVLAVAATGKAHLLALCSGGILASMVAAYLADTSEIDRLATLSLAVTVLDQARAGLASAVLDEKTARMAAAASARRGYLDGGALAEVFAWLRPNDLVWNYWVNNYLEGRQPPPFDVLYWNADTTRMPAQLHGDFLTLALTNALTKPGEATMLGRPVDLSKVTVDSYIVAGISDHLCPWQSCYATTQLLGGENRFILSTAGHIAALVNPPTNPKAAFQTNDANVANPADWLRDATSEKGSWWPDYARWLDRRSGGHQPAPDAPGSPTLAPLDPAPGTYVFER